MCPLKHYRENILQLKISNQYRQLPNISPLNGIIDFSTNDYLNLSQDKSVLESAIEAAHLHGVGSTGSRLLSGNSYLFESLETQIAEDKNSEGALIFNSGFQANISTLSALLDSKVLGRVPLVFFDRENHASLYQAIFLSKAQMIRYSHNDMQNLSILLKRHKEDQRPKFIVTESLFGMSGDLLPIEEVVCLAQEYGAFLYLDEAHATGLYGHSGYGLSTLVDLSNISYVIMGTFSKAIGCSGGYVACSKVIKEYLINKASGFIYSTSNSPMLVGAITKAWSIIKNLDQERKYLFSLASFAREQILDLGFSIGASNSHIIPIILESEEKALFYREKLLKHNILVSCLRPPTVPPATSRIRIALRIDHKKEDIDNLIHALNSI